MGLQRRQKKEDKIPAGLIKKKELLIKRKQNTCGTTMLTQTERGEGWGNRVGGPSSGC